MKKHQIRSFQRVVRNFYKKEGRRLPWRETKDPYRILVSEFMLQQTQVERVLPYYAAFLKKFPTVRSLCKANLGEVLKVWQGLGYNRRAKFLHRTAEIVCRLHGGKIPDSLEALEDLPGIGSYTARAILTFAFNERLPLIETNVRAVYLHHFFKNSQSTVRDEQLLALIERSLPSTNLREWYNGLMDYGSFLKSKGLVKNQKSAHYLKQKPFKGSRRELRGIVLRLATSRQTITEDQVFTESRRDREEIFAVVKELLKEGFLVRKGRRGFSIK